jgi:hypothetical protein
VRHGLLWLAVTNLRQTPLRSSVVALAIALAVLAMTLFVRQVSLHEAEVTASYEQAGAATFIAELNGAADAEEPSRLATAVRQAAGVSSVEVPYSGVRLGLVADASFLVFQNEQQKEYLGARTTVLGVDRTFDPTRDYYVDYHELNEGAPRKLFGIPLFWALGEARQPARDEFAIASDVTDYVGVRPGTTATVDLIFGGTVPAIVRRLEGVRLIGTFDASGPDRGRFDPFWQLAVQGEEVLTVRRPDATEGVTTALPILLNEDVVREFLDHVRAELAARRQVPSRSLVPDRLVIRASSIAAVPVAETATKSLLEKRLGAEECHDVQAASFCIRLPERNNFETAQREQRKVGTGATYFLVLLLVLIAVGAAGLQIQVVLARWRDFGVLAALGFSPGQVLRLSIMELGGVIGSSLVLAFGLLLVMPFGIGDSLAAFMVSAAVVTFAAVAAALPALLWPLSRRPAELLRVAE